MITYNKLEVGTPPDVELVTDDAGAEMAALDEMIKECEFEIELPSGRGDDEKFHLVIPGAMVGEFSECVGVIDNGILENLTEKWNQESLDALGD